MEEFDKIQKLIRLKRFESPPPDFAENLISRLRVRECSEMLKQSAPAMLWEQTRIWFDQLCAPKWALAATGFAVVALSAWTLMPGNPRNKHYFGRARSVTFAIDGTGATIPAFSVEAIRVMGASVEPDPGLLSKHFQGSYEQFILFSDGEADEAVANPYQVVVSERSR